MADMTIVKQKKTPNYFAFPERSLKSGMEGGWEIVLARPYYVALPKRLHQRSGIGGLGDTVLAHPDYIALPEKLW